MAKPKNLTTESKDVSWSKLQEIVRDREAWRTTVHGVTESQTRLRDRTTICMRKKERTDRNTAAAAAESLQSCPTLC